MTLVSKGEATEDVPLQEFTNSELIEDGLESRKEEWCITKTKLVLLTTAIVALLVVIIVLVVLFGMEKRTELKGMCRIQLNSNSCFIFNPRIFSFEFYF